MLCFRPLSIALLPRDQRHVSPCEPAQGAASAGSVGGSSPQYAAAEKSSTRFAARASKKAAG